MALRHVCLSCLRAHQMSTLNDAVFWYTEDTSCRCNTHAYDLDIGVQNPPKESWKLQQNNFITIQNVEIRSYHMHQNTQIPSVTKRSAVVRIHYLYRSFFFCTVAAMIILVWSYLLLMEIKPISTAIYRTQIIRNRWLMHVFFLYQFRTKLND